MSNQTPIPTPNPTPDAAKHKQKHNPVKKTHEEAVSRAEKVVATAKKPAYAAVLATREIDTAFVTTLAQKNANARSLMGQTVEQTIDKTSATKAESVARTNLVGLMCGFRKLLPVEFRKLLPGVSPGGVSASWPWGIVFCHPRRPEGDSHHGSSKDPLLC